MDNSPTEKHENGDNLNNLINEADDIFRKIVHRKNSKIIYLMALEEAKKTGKNLEVEYIKGKIDFLDGKYGNAIKHFNKAIKIDSKYCKAWHYKALCLSRLDENEKSLKIYDKIIETAPNADSWYNKGIILDKRDMLVDALNCFNEAVKIEPEHALAWNRKSMVLNKLERYKEAIESYETALSIDNENPYIRNNKYLPKMFLGSYDEERKRRKTTFEEEKKKIWKLNLPKNEEFLKINEVETEEKEKLLEIDAIKEVIKELEEEYNSILEQKKEYEKALSDLLSPRTNSEENNPSDKNYLMVLRRWNSYTPAMRTDLESNVGGGYFINWKGKGIVIDPGFDFLKNFFNQNFIVDDIDAVIITHAHIDHCNDFESLLTLIYEYNENINKESSFKKNYISKYLENVDSGKIETIFDIDTPLSDDMQNISKNRYFNKFSTKGNIFFNYMYKEDDKKFFGLKKSIDVFMNLGAMKKYLGWIPIEKGNEDVKINRIYPLEKGITYKLDDYNIKINVIESKHNEVLSKTYSCGLIFELYDNLKDPNSQVTKIGYTSDTMHKEYIEDYYNGVDVIIPHLGSIDDNDFNLKTDKRNKNHLMLKGVISTIYRSNAKLAIISEFGEELKEHKIKIVKALNKVFQSHSMARCLTGDVGLKIFIPELTVNCFYESSSCHDEGRGIDVNEIFEEIDPDNDSASVIHFCKGCKNLYDDKNQHHN